LTTTVKGRFAEFAYLQFKLISQLVAGTRIWMDCAHFTREKKTLASLLYA